MNNRDIIVIFVICIGIFIGLRFVNNKDNKIVVDNTYEMPIIDIIDTAVVDNVKENPKKTIEDLQNSYRNSDIEALLRIPNTSYETVVPQGDSNAYYHRRLPDKSYSLNGSTYLDYRTNLGSRVLLIYGHNSSQYDMPFKILENYYDNEYFNSHKYIELVTSDGIKTYKIFSVHVETSDFSYFYNINFESDGAFLNHVRKLKEKSFYDTLVDVDSDDNILILQACSTLPQYRSYAKKFILIISKEVNKNEINEETN